MFANTGGVFDDSPTPRPQLFAFETFGLPDGDGASRECETARLRLTVRVVVQLHTDEELRKMKPAAEWRREKSFALLKCLDWIWLEGCEAGRAGKLQVYKVQIGCYPVADGGAGGCGSGQVVRICHRLESR